MAGWLCELPHFSRQGESRVSTPGSPGAGLSRRDYQRANASFDRSTSETPRQCLLGFVGCRFQPRRAARLDLAAQRRALAIGDGRLARRGCAADVIDGFDGNVAKAGALQVAADQVRIVIAVRRA